MSRPRFLAALLALAPFAPTSSVATDAPVDGEFFDVRFLRRTLADFGSRDAFVLCFTRVGCPLVPRQLPELEALQREYAPRNVQFVGVDVGADDTVVDAAALALDHGATFPFVLDRELATARACGATRAGEVVVLDRDRRVAYRGRIDARLRVGGEAADPGRPDLRLALDAVLGGTTPELAQTPAEGCLISPAPTPTPGLTWSHHVRPLLERHCVECHQPGGAAPFALLDAATAGAHAAMIAEVVASGRMPPWHAASHHGRFRNARLLAPDERRTLIDWAKSGAARGDPAVPPIAAPAAPAADGADWRIGRPDLVLATPTEMELPATGSLPYQYALLPHVFAVDTWVEAVEIRADNPRVMHHCNLAHVRLGEAYRSEHFITGQVPGGDPLDLEPGLAVRLPAGSLLALQIHYVPSGKPERDRLRVALRFPRHRVEKELHHLEIAEFGFAIPPGAPAHPVAAARTFPTDAVGVGLFVHMHRRGRDFRFTAHAPGASGGETLLLVPTWDFDWQASYRWFPGRARFAAGTRIDGRAHFDNSRFNPWNPDPTATVRFGQQTEHEMMYGFLFWVAADERLHLDVDPATGRALR
ncbi:MAG: redoxin domain-containing protein [Planctomycetes bacterium]|nr:redoxin domain-containing protein [Planctomycetota bacterium]